MTIKELMNLFDLDSDLDLKINSIKTDTRLIEPGDVFIALKGKNYDGNDYIEEAISKGAILCITERDYPNTIKMNGIDALYKIGKYIRSKYVYGLTATPTRKDGWHKIIYMQCGDIRVRVSKKN